MGQLEKYGLYVLCLVCFLILGVAIWGEPQAVRGAGSELAQRVAEPRGSTQKAPIVDLDALQVNGAGTPPPRPISPAPNGAGAGSERQPDPVAPPAPHDASTPAPAGPANGSNGSNGANGPGTGPASDARRTHEVADGETFESIAKALGDVRFVPVLLELNPRVEPKRMKIGTKLQLPSKAEQEAQLAKWSSRGAGSARTETADAPAASVRTHRIEKGDTFEGLATRLLGKASRVDEIQQLNPTVNPTQLRVGQRIKIPAR